MFTIFREAGNNYQIRWDWDYWTPSFVYVSILFLVTAESN